MIDGFNPWPTSNQRCCGLNAHGLGSPEPPWGVLGLYRIAGQPRFGRGTLIPGSALPPAANSSVPSAAAGTRLVCACSPRTVPGSDTEGHRGFGVFAEHAVMSPSQKNVYREGNRCR